MSDQLARALAFGTANPIGRAAASGSGQRAPVKSLADTWPGQLVQALIGGATLPGDVYAGRVDPNSDESIRRAAELAGLAGGVPGGVGGLGSGVRLRRGALPMDAESRIGRAREQGFDTDHVWYHGTAREFDRFDLSKSGSASGDPSQSAVFLTPHAGEASHFAKVAGAREPMPGERPHSITEYMGDKLETVYDGANVIPAYVRPGKQLVVEQVPEWHRDGRNLYNTKAFARIIEDARAKGFDTVVIKNVDEGHGFGAQDQMIVLTPENIRSKWAMFDPRKTDSTDILHSSASAATLPKDRPVTNEEYQAYLKAGGA